MKKGIPLILLALAMACGGPEPRRPVQVKTGRFFKESVERGKKLLAAEENLIRQVIESDSIHEYHHSASGSWYYYDVRNDDADYTPQTDDIVTMTYNVLTMEGDTIYSTEDVGLVTYRVDRQELFPGLRNSVKLLKEKETATFFFPSSLAYGYHGDNNKIGINVPIKSTISILKIEKNEDRSK